MKSKDKKKKSGDNREWDMFFHLNRDHQKKAYIKMSDRMKTINNSP